MQLQVSRLQQYFVVVFRDQPLELWDCHALTLLKPMPASFPVVAGLEWSVVGLKRTAQVIGLFF